MTESLKCDLILFADAANFSEEGKLNLLGEFNILKTNGTHALLRGRLVTRVTGTPADIGDHRFSLRILDADANLVATSPTIPLTISASRVEGLPPRTVVIMDLPQLALAAPGIYDFQLYVDDVRQELTAELHVLRVG